jgi:TatA/E family protein of Tat protein translocase
MHRASCAPIGARPAPRLARPAGLVQIRAPGAAPGPAGPSPRSRSPLGGAPQQQQRSVVARGLFGLGVPELVVIAGVAALIFGPSKLPELGKGLGKTVKSFQTAAKEFETELKAAAADDADKPKDGGAGGDKKPE